MCARPSFENFPELRAESGAVFSRDGETRRVVRAALLRGIAHIREVKAVTGAVKKSAVAFSELAKGLFASG